MSSHLLFKASRKRAMTLIELMFAISIGSVVFTGVLILYILLLRGASDTSAIILTQRKASLLTEKVIRGPMGVFGGMHSVYYNEVGTPGAPNPLIVTLSTNPTNQTFSFYVQTNFNSFTCINLTNYTDPSVAALYKIGYNSTNHAVYYTVNNGPEINLMSGFAPGVDVTRFMFVQNTNASVNFEFDLIIPKSNGQILTNSYNSVIAYRNTPQE
jgi:prepilin-type N-terminal cleavage/methylation domain-containing protein